MPFALSSRFAMTLLVTLCPLAAAIWWAPWKAERPPFDHVVLVTIDTLRADHLGCYGYPRPVSPFIDSLAEDGIRFERVIASASHTAPSHASIFTSQFPARHRVLINGSKLDSAIPTIASFFQTSGFETTAVVAVGLLREIAVGFEKVLYRSPKPPIPWTADHITSEAIQWLEGRETESSFFLWVHFFDAHTSLGPQATPPEEYRLRLNQHFRHHGDQLHSFWTEEQGLTDEVLRDSSQIDTYDAQIAFIDAELRRLFEAVEAAGSRVLWVITSDHGEGLGNHDYVGHGKYLYQEQVRVPLIFYSSQDRRAGVTVGEMVRHVDLLPTLTELASIEIDPDALDIEGHSMVGLLNGDELGWTPQYAYSQRRPADEDRLLGGWSLGLVLAVQNERYKYILKTGGDDEFYDLAADPLELRNLAAKGPVAGRPLAVWLARKYREMVSQPLGGNETEVEAGLVDELRALGYLK